jgi:hypothetical protein
MLSKPLVLALAVSPLVMARGQMFAARSVIATPLDDTSKVTGLLPAFYYAAELQRGWQSAGDDRAWDARFVGTIELWRSRSERTSFLVVSGDEMVANDRKDGGFNPRGISWELDAAAQHRVASTVAELAIVHYCRHEIDNADPPGPAYYQVGYTPTERTISLNGVKLQVIAPEATWRGMTRVRAAFGGEVFAHAWDGRAPDVSSVNSWSQARGAARMVVRIDQSLIGSSTLFARGFGLGMLFRERDNATVAAAMQSVHRFELGVRVPGAAGALEAYGALEHTFDDLGTNMPRPSRVMGVGIRLAAHNQF